MHPPETSTWHFFRRDGNDALWCAVPAHQALPSFLLSGCWRFSGHRAELIDGPPGFDPRAASVGDRFNGFHLFQVTRETPGWRGA